MFNQRTLKLEMKPVSFGDRAMVSHLMFIGAGLVVLTWSWLSKNFANTREDFAIFINFFDAAQVSIPIISIFIIYLIVSIISHQSGSDQHSSNAYRIKEILHGEISSILLSSSSLALAIGILFFIYGSFFEGIKALAWWPAGLALSYFLRPRSQDPYGIHY